MSVLSTKMKVFSLRVAILGLNGTILALGVLLSYIGISWIQFEIKYEKATENQFVYIGAVLIALGLFLCNTTIVGCCGALSKNKFLLAINTFIFLLIFVIYFDFGIVAFHLKDASSPYMKNIDVELEKVLRKKHKGWKSFYNYIQKKFKCCGFDGFQDYQRVLNRSHLKSCCSYNSDCQEPTYKLGCTKPLQDYIGEKFVFFGAISFTVAILGLIAGIFSYIVKRMLRSGQFSTSGEL